MPLPQFVQCVGVNEIAGASATTTASITATAGNLLVAAVRWGGASTDTLTFSDNSGSNTWANTSDKVEISGFLGGMGYAANVAGGTYTVTATTSPSGTFRALIVAEYSGIQKISPLNVGTATTANTTTSVTSSAFSTSRANELVIMATSYTFNNDLYTGGLIGSLNGTLRVDNSDDFGLMDRVINPIETNITATMNESGGTQNWVAMVASFFPENFVTAWLTA